MNDKTFRENLVDALTKEQAHLSLKSALENLKTENRNTRPAPEIHSVWEQLEHMRITQEDIVQYILDPAWKSPQWPDEYWPDKNEKVSEVMWNSSIAAFNADLQKLVNIIKDANTDITSVIPHTKNHTYLREMLIVIDHNSYHTAQIVETRKILGDWKE